MTESFLSLIESNTDFDFCIGSLFLSNFLDIKSIIPSIPILVAILERDISFSSIDVSKASPMVDAVLDFLNNFWPILLPIKEVANVFNSSLTVSLVDVFGLFGFGVSFPSPFPSSGFGLPGLFESSRSSSESPNRLYNSAAAPATAILFLFEANFVNIDFIDLVDDNEPNFGLTLDNFGLILDNLVFKDLGIIFCNNFGIWFFKTPNNFNGRVFNFLIIHVPTGSPKQRVLIKPPKLSKRPPNKPFPNFPVAFPTVSFDLAPIEDAIDSNALQLLSRRDRSCLWRASISALSLFFNFTGVPSDPWVYAIISPLASDIYWIFFFLLFWLFKFSLLDFLSDWTDWEIALEAFLNSSLVKSSLVNFFCSSLASVTELVTSSDSSLSFPVSLLPK